MESSEKVKVKSLPTLTILGIQGNFSPKVTFSQILRQNIMIIDSKLAAIHNQNLAESTQ